MVHRGRALSVARTLLTEAKAAGTSVTRRRDTQKHTRFLRERLSQYNTTFGFHCGAPGYTLHTARYPKFTYGGVEALGALTHIGACSVALESQLA